MHILLRNNSTHIPESYKEKRTIAKPLMGATREFRTTTTTSSFEAKGNQVMKHHLDMKTKTKDSHVSKTTQLKQNQQSI
jgi:hypothetical protein